MKWLALIVSAILAAYLLRTCTQAKPEVKAPEVAKPAVVPSAAPAPAPELAKPALPSFGKWAAAVAGDKLSLEGTVKDQAAKDAILAAAKSVFGEANVADKLTLDAALPGFNFGGKWADLFTWLKGKAMNLAFDGAGVKLSGEMGDALISSAIAKLKSLFGDGVNLTNELKATAMAAADAFKAGAKNFRLNVEFDTGKATIRKESFKELDDLAAVLKDGKTKGEVGGHTDNVGQAESNLKLSQARAEAVAAYLFSKGVPKEALTAKGYGDTKPVAANDTPENKQRNRRVEFVAQ
jgi:outer membrane protein OmpA-like peptidoglycan-associated protein